MMKNSIRFTLSLVVLTCLFFSASAQKGKYIHSYGNTFWEPVKSTDGNENFQFIGFSYSPRYVLKELGEKSSLSLVSRLQYGISNGFTSTGDGITTTDYYSTYFSVPVMAQYSFGRYATTHANHRLGFFGEAGFDFSSFTNRIETRDYNTGNIISTNNSKTSSFGLVAGAGVRLKWLFAGGTSMHNRWRRVQETEVRFLYKLPFGKSPSLYGLGVDILLNKVMVREGGRSSGAGRVRGFGITRERRNYRNRLPRNNRVNRRNKYRRKWIRKNGERRYFRHDRTGGRGNSFRY